MGNDISKLAKCICSPPKAPKFRLLSFRSGVRNDNRPHSLLRILLAGRSPSADGLAQPFQQAFELGLAMLHPRHAL